MFVFIVDNQMSSKETISALDYCKYAVECFVASYSGADISSAPPMMLLQTGQSDECLLSSFGDPISLFEQKLKNVDCKGAPRALTTLDFTYPISYALSTVNTYRMKSGVDTFGHGRALW